MLRPCRGGKQEQIWRDGVVSRPESRTQTNVNTGCRDAPRLAGCASLSESFLTPNCPPCSRNTSIQLYVLVAMDKDIEIRSSAPTHVYKALVEAVPTTIADWADMFLGLDLPTFCRWTSAIWQGDWYNDRQIHDALEIYCGASWPDRRHQPFIDIVTRVLTMAPQTLDLDGPKNMYPVGAVAVVGNTGWNLRPIPERGLRAAMRDPDVLLVPEAAEPNDAEEVEWKDVLTWFELTSHRTEYDYKVDWIDMGEHASAPVKEVVAEAQQRKVSKSES